MNRLHQLSDRWPEISALLDEGLEMPATERAQWLQSLSGDRAEVRDTVRELLASHARAETANFLHTLPKAKAAAASAHSDTLVADELIAGDLIGAYRVISPLGRGGMGVVWLAERADGQLQRQVALKLPRMAWGSAVAERLARERDILASLNHPHIAHLYDAGVDPKGRPYLAMEYVEGQPIDVYCRERALAVSDRLALVLQVAAAVAHAHAQLVVHRDLKPANILVTREGQARLLDFGIAKLMEGQRTEETALTQLSGRVLTLDYASPEQICGEPLGTASDIYSLGVLAFELLAGARPYALKRGSAAELEEAIASVDARLASEVATAPMLRRQLRGDLDAILNKALKKNPGERYATVDAFAEDLRRHLQQQPVLAQADRLGYRAGKFVQRYRLQVAAAGVSAVALLAGTGVALWQAREARLQAARAEEVKDLVVSIFKDSHTAHGGSRKTTAAELLTQAQKRLVDTPVSDPAVRAEMLTSIGAGLTALSEYQAAQRLLEQVVSEASAKLGAQHPRTIAAQLALVAATVELGVYDKAEPILDAALQQLMHLPPDSNRVEALRLKAILYARLRRLEPSEAAAREAVAAAESMPEASSLRERMLAQHTLAQTLTDVHRPGHLEPARKAYEIALQLAGGRVTVDVLSARSLYALSLILEGEAARALAELKAVLPPMIELLGPQNQQVQRTYGRIADAAETLGDPRAVIDASRRALEIELAWSNSERTGRSGLYGLGIARGLTMARRFDEAEQEMRHALVGIRAYKAPWREHDFRMSDTYLAGALIDSGKLDEADATLAPLFRTPFDNRRVEVAAKFVLCRLRSAQGRHAEALRLAAELGPQTAAWRSRIGRARALLIVGNAYLEAGSLTDALTSLETARALFDALQPAMSPERADLLMSLAQTQLALGEPSKAVPMASEALKFWRDFDRSNRQTVRAALLHAHTLLDIGAVNDTVQALREAEGSVKEFGGQKEQAWLGKLKSRLAPGTGRV